MARRYDHSREELHGMALGAAREIVAEAGLRALTTRRLAAQIGYSAGTIYNLFANLDDLVVHLNGTTLDALYRPIAAVQAGPDPVATLKAQARAYIAFTHDNFHLWNALFEHRLPPDQPLPSWYGTKVERLLKLVEAVLEPVIADDNPRTTAARVLWSSLHGICSLAMAEKLDIVATESAIELADSLIESYLSGLEVGAR